MREARRNGFCGKSAHGYAGSCGGIRKQQKTRCAGRCGYRVGVKRLGVSSGTYFGAITDYLDGTDIRNGLYKSLCFGGLIAWVCCYKGFYAGFGAEGVSKATTQAVVLTSVLILVGDYFLTSVLF